MIRHCLFHVIISFIIPIVGAAQSLDQWEARGDSLLAKYRSEEARRVFQLVEQAKPKPALWFKMATTYNKDNKHENEKARFWLQKVLRTERDDTLLLAQTYTLLGDEFRHINVFDSAEIYLKKGCFLGQKYAYIHPLRLLARLYINTGDIANASQYAYQVLRKAEQNHNTALLPFIYLDLGVINQALNKFKEADKYFYKAIRLERNNQFSEVLGMLYEALGTQLSDESAAKEDVKSAIKAIRFFEKGYEASLRINDTQGIAFHLMNMAKRYAFLKQIAKAKKLFKQSEIMFNKLGYPDKMAAFYITYGDFLYSYAGEKKQGLILIEKAADLWVANKYKMNQVIAFEALSKGYEQLGDYKRSLFFTHKFNELDKEIAGESTQKQLQELNLKYDTEKKDAQLAEQKLEIVQKQQRITQIALIAILFVLALSSFFALYRWYQQRKIRQLESTFEQTAQQLQSFNYSVSHDLRHPLISAQYTLDKLKNTSLSSEQLTQIQKTEGSLKNMNDIIEAMLTLSAIERDALTIKAVDLKELILDVLEEFSTQVNVQLKDLPTVRADIRQLRQVIINLLSNAVKYTAHQPDPKIQITGHEDNGKIWVVVEDNGLGFDEQFSAKLFQLFGRLHPDVDGVGVGLVIVKRIIEKHGGTVWAKGKKGKGAVFGFTLPK